MSSNSPAIGSDYGAWTMLLPADAVDRRPEANRERIEATLVDWLRIPSISAPPRRADDVARLGGVRRRARLRDGGLEHVA